MSLLPTPLHPAIVHFPVVFAVIAPIFAAVALFAIRRGAAPLKAWGATVALLGALTLSAWAALETGEDQEERVESVVAESALSTHEEAAELFLSVSGVVLAIGLVGLAPNRAGTAARAAATLGTIALVALGYNVGHSGGQLVYQHGAASAYTTGTAGPATDGGERAGPGGGERSGDDDDR